MTGVQPMRRTTSAPPATLTMTRTSPQVLRPHQAGAAPGGSWQRRGHCGAAQGHRGEPHPAPQLWGEPRRGAAGSPGTVPGPTDPLPRSLAGHRQATVVPYVPPRGSAWLWLGGPPGSMSPNTACPCPPTGHVASLTPAPSNVDPEGTLAAGETVLGGPRGVGGVPGVGGAVVLQPLACPLSLQVTAQGGGAHQRR